MLIVAAIELLIISIYAYLLHKSETKLHKAEDLWTKSDTDFDKQRVLLENVTAERDALLKLTKKQVKRIRAR